MVINPFKNKRLRLGRLIIILVLIVAVLNMNNIFKTAYPLPYKEIIHRQATANDLDPYLLAAVIKTESNFRHNAVSPKGAAGLMQIMPETAQWAAEKSGFHDYSQDMLYEPEVNIRLGAWYLANLYEEFDDQTIPVLAAYNGGRGNVNKWLDSNLWTGELRTLDRIPFVETRNYVRKVLWHQRLFHLLYD